MLSFHQSTVTTKFAAEKLLSPVDQLLCLNGRTKSAFQAQASDHLFGELYLSNLAKISWHPIDDIPNLAFETARQQPKLGEVFQQLHAFQKNRLKFAIHRALFKKRKKSTTPKLVPRTNFDETYF